MYTLAMRFRIIEDITRLAFLCLFCVTLHAQNQAPAYFVSLRFDNLNAKISNEAISDFLVVSQFIQMANQLTKKSLFHPIPQALDAFELMSWFNLSQVGAAVLPVPLFHLLQKAGLLDSFVPLAFLPDDAAYLVANTTGNLDCNTFSLTKHAFSANDEISFPNEYHNKGFLLYHTLTRLNPSLALADLYFYQDDSASIKRFLKKPDRGGTRFGIFSQTVLPRVLSNPGACIVAKDLTTDVSGYFLLIHKSIPLDKSVLDKMHGAFVTQVDAIPKTLRPYFKLYAEAITEPKALQQKIRAIDAYYQNIPALPKLTYKNVSERLADEVGNNSIALAFMGGGARTPYTFRFGNEFIREVIEPTHLDNQVVLLGISGGAINSLALSVLKPNTLVGDETTSRLSDITRYISPSLRSRVIATVIQYPKATMLAAALIFLYYFFSIGHILFTRKIVHSWLKIAILVASIIAAVLIPDIPIEYVILLLVGIFFISVVLHLFMRRYAPGLAIHVASAAIFVVLFVGMAKLPFARGNLFDRFNVDTAMADLLKGVGDNSCIGSKNRQELSRCLFAKVRYPIVITTTEVNALNRLNFYVRPASSNIIFPSRFDWINLAECPEHLLDVVEGSTALPAIFAPPRFSCGAKTYELSDGGVISSLPLEQASELHIHYQFLFWNSFIDMNNHFLSLQKVLKNPSMVDHLQLSWTSGFQQVFDREAIQRALQQTFFISLPRIELIQSSDFWGGYLGDGRFVLPSELAKLATQDFFARPGTFTELAKGHMTPNTFWLRYKSEIEAVMKDMPSR